MCLGIPMRIVECDGWRAVGEAGTTRRSINLALVGEQPAGTWVLVVQAMAREVLSAEDAFRIGRALEGVDAALRGESDLSIYFEDLVARPPRLREM
ncbi:MAG: HypC/HybG/HupF family hydrogenase formation chaperone [Casimicrobiaceae bacterium]